MFRQMRRKEKELDKAAVEKILNEAHYGVVAVNGDEDYPYAFPINFAYYNDKIIFHGAKSGYKNDLFSTEKKVAFTAVLEETILAEKFDSLYKSVICFGKCHMIEDETEKKAAAFSLIEKYSSEFEKEGIEYINKATKATAVYEIEIDHITAKEGK
ncbi:MAG: pyridoxamine 5'-phosphate oxidase family protein [Peptostreptococcaceae bacterium]|nr:pyridoxamine 5'-phosphate oxidase family protein [Peptostreptococcaceae bacterium]